MATSTTNTVYGIISDAMHDAGLLGEGDEPNSEELAPNMRRLNDMVNLWQTQGLKLFLLENVEVPLIAGQRRYTFGPLGDVVMPRPPTRALQGYVLNESNVRRPLVILAWEEWMRLSQIKGNDSSISSFFVDKQAGELAVSFWNTPDDQEAQNTVHLLMQVAAPNQSNLEANTQFPQEWRIALRWGLADDIATGQPSAIMSRCSARARAYREVLENWDVEDASTRMSLDSRMFTHSGRFL